MDKKISVRKVVQLSDNDKRTLLAYSNFQIEKGQPVTSKAAVEKSLLKLA